MYEHTDSECIVYKWMVSEREDGGWMVSGWEDSEWVGGWWVDGEWAKGGCLMVSGWEDTQVVCVYEWMVPWWIKKMNSEEMYGMKNSRSLVAVWMDGDFMDGQRMGGWMLGGRSENR